MEPTNIDELITVYGPSTWDVYAALDRSLDPSGPGELFEIAGQHLFSGSVVLDAGCRNAAHLIELVQRFDVVGVGVEPVPRHVESARAAIRTAQLEDRVTIHQTGIQSMPLDAASVDAVWCRDVFEQLDDPLSSLHEISRVTKPAAPMVLYTTVVTEHLTEPDRAILRAHLGNVDRNLDQGWLESQFDQAGFSIESVRSIGTEWREHAEERTQPVSRALLRLARLRRQSAEMQAIHGPRIYRHVEANLHWELFQFLGKLDPRVYVLRTPRNAVT